MLFKLLVVLTSRLVEGLGPRQQTDEYLERTTSNIASGGGEINHLTPVKEELLSLLQLVGSQRGLLHLEARV